jgi:hypothetical protein
MTATTHTAPRELDSRSADGIDVQLLWHPAESSISVVVYDATHDATFEVTVDLADALDAFHHPFAYAASAGVPFLAPHRAHDEAQATAA